jgi:Zn-dependent protease with chaperone function
MANGIKTALLLGLLSGVLLVIGELLGGASGLVVAFGFAVVMNFVSYWFSDKIVLSTTSVLRLAITADRTPPRLLGRVSAVNQIFIGSSNEIGSFESGVAAKLLGTVRSVIIGGLVTLGVVGVTAWKIPSLRRLDHPE